MEPRTRRALSVVGGFALAFAVLYVLVRVVGVADVLAALLAADPVGVGAAFALALGWMAAWSYTLYLVAGTLGRPTSLRGSFLVYLTVLFANNVAPFSVGGGEPLAALFVARSTGGSYERSLLAVMSTDVLNYLPSPAFAILGSVYVASTTGPGRRLEAVAGTLLVVGALLAGTAVLAWRYRGALEVRAVAVLLAMQRVAARVVPGGWRLSPAALRSRVGTFVDGVEQVAADRRVVRLGLASSALGWVLQGAVLWTSLYAVGASVPLAVAVFVVTLVTVTDVVPLPGGVGTVDAALVVVLVAVTGVPAATATAGTLVFRGATLAFSVVLGGTVVLVLDLHPALAQ